MTDLADRELNPPRGGGVSPLEGAELQRFHEKLGDGWEVIDDRHLERQYNFAGLSVCSRLCKQSRRACGVGRSPPRPLLRLGEGQHHNLDPQHQWPF